MTLVHALDHRQAAAPADLSGSIGVGSQEALLEQLAAHDQLTGKLALERGRHLLEGARARVVFQGAAEPSVRQVHGSLVDLLVEQEAAAPLFVIGKRGEGAHRAQDHLGSNLERVIRAMHRPVLVVPAEYREPASVMLAFDNGPSTRHGVELVVMGAYGHSRIRHLLVGSTTSAMIRRVESPLLLLR